jgi:hypothetical protein
MYSEIAPLVKVDGRPIGDGKLARLPRRWPKLSKKSLQTTGLQSQYALNVKKNTYKQHGRLRIENISGWGYAARIHFVIIYSKILYN